jgi:branched-chain amino acid transport system permease protein
MIEELKKSLLTAVWFMFLTFPIMVIRVNTIHQTVEWRWDRMFMVGIGAFFLSLLWRFMLRRKEATFVMVESGKKEKKPLLLRLRQDPRFVRPALILTLIFFLSIPLLFSWHKTTIMTNALIYTVLALGLNIVVGLAGLLDLGYVAFFAVGAYSYALLNLHFDIGFWAALPIGGALGLLFGLLLGFPVLRLRGDYLAIVTLGFGQIVRLVLENWNELSYGPSGIDNIPAPGLFGMSMTLKQTHIYIYYLMVALTLFAVIMVRRLKDSRIGRAWMALREDETACVAMGIDKTRAKLSAFALGATWAGMGGVVFAAKQKFINPYSFTIWESIMILCIVVLGGMGSIAGIVIAAMLLIILPESLKVFADYRWLVFGALLVAMMVFRPGGIVGDSRRVYELKSVAQKPKDDG